MSSSRSVKLRTIDLKTADNIWRGLYTKMECITSVPKAEGDAIVLTTPIVTHGRSRMAGEIITFVRRAVAELKDDNVQVSTVPLLLGATVNKFNEQRSIPAMTATTAYSRDAVREHVLRNVANSQIGEMHVALLDNMGADFVLVEVTVHLSAQTGHVAKYRRVFDLAEIMELHEKASPDSNNSGRFWTPYYVTA